MFESLTDRLNETFGRLGRKGRLTEADVDEAMREVRRALLEADVNFKVAKEFVAAVKEQAVGEDVLASLTPAQTAIGIVHDELINVLGREREPLLAPDRPPADPDAGRPATARARRPTPASSPSTSARRAATRCWSPRDVYRPAAINQLQTLGRQINIPVYEEGTDKNPVDIARNAVRYAARARLQPGHHRHRRPPADRRAADAGAGEHQRADRSRPRSCSSPTR